MVVHYLLDKPKRLDYIIIKKREVGEMRIQEQLSNGMWIDCGDRTEEFLTRCEKFNGGMTRNEVMAALETGKSLRNDAADWYSNCRDGEAMERIMAARRAASAPVKMVKCACGHTIPSGSVMSTSGGTSCPDCYDRMSR